MVWTESQNNLWEQLGKETEKAWVNSEASQKAVSQLEMLSKSLKDNNDPQVKAILEQLAGKLKENAPAAQPKENADTSKLDEEILKTLAPMIPDGIDKNIVQKNIQSWDFTKAYKRWLFIVKKSLESWKLNKDTAKATVWKLQERAKAHNVDTSQKVWG